LLERALTAEVDEFLGRQRYARGGDWRGYRNGHQRPRQVAVGTLSVPVRAPRVSDVRAGTPGFESEILPKRQRLSNETQKLFAQLYLEGLSSGDFEPVFRQLLGENAPLSPNTILRLKEEWEPARSRPATAPGLHRRRQPGAVGSAGRGLPGGAPPAMLESSPPEFEGQAAQATAGDGQLADLRGLPGAHPSGMRVQARRPGRLVAHRDQPAAAETLRRDWDDFVTFYDFPTEHWLHLRTSNPIESVFAGVRLRTDVAKRARNRDNALYLVFKVVQRLGRNWRALNGGPNLMQLVLAGAVFKDGRLQQWPGQPQQKEVTAA
jgi:hypothetical protein